MCGAHTLTQCIAGASTQKRNAALEEFVTLCPESPVTKLVGETLGIEPKRGIFGRLFG
jgi:hypothetical protein